MKNIRFQQENTSYQIEMIIGQSDCKNKDVIVSDSY